MPGTLLGTIDLKSSLDPQRDGNYLRDVIRNAYSQTYDELKVFFLAEKHRDPFDVERSQIVFDEFAHATYANKLCLVAERDLFKGSEFSHLVKEPFLGHDSRDLRRNELILDELDEYRKKKPSVKILVFFYGEEHLEPIKELLINREPSGTKIRWVTSLSFDTTLEGIKPNQRIRVNTNNIEPAGYAVGYQPKQIYCLQLLTKGYWIQRFMVTLFPKSVLRTLVTVRTQNPVFEIYFSNPFTHNEVKTSVDQEGGADYYFETFDGSNTAIAKQISVKDLLQ
jgi:hypothetical protein